MSDAETPQDSAATPDPEGPMCYGFAADGVWMDTHYGWVIPDEASVADGGSSAVSLGSQGVDSMVNMPSNRRAFDSRSGTTLTDRPVCAMSLGTP